MRSAALHALGGLRSLLWPVQGSSIAAQAAVSSRLFSSAPSSSTETPKFLVTGASGQIGAELISLLRSKHGAESVIASDVRLNHELMAEGPFVYLDVLDKNNMARLCLENQITHMVHLATVLSAVGEKNPQLALSVNTVGIQNVLDLAKQYHMRVFAPSTIAVFGNRTPRINTPDLTIMRPSTMYGLTKVHQELLGDYYYGKFGVDYRSLRYPGIISSKTMPGGGTTDYAVEIFLEALVKGRYDCFLAADTALPFMYMPDCLAATYQLIMAPPEQLTQRTYNVTAASFTPAQLAESISKELPRFEIRYKPDWRQAIADTWPASIDDSRARADWGWQHQYSLDAMTRDMLESLDQKLRTGYKKKGEGALGSA